MVKRWVYGKNISAEEYYDRILGDGGSPTDAGHYRDYLYWGYGYERFKTNIKTEEHVREQYQLEDKVKTIRREKKSVGEAVMDEYQPLNRRSGSGYDVTGIALGEDQQMMTSASENEVITDMTDEPSEADAGADIIHEQKPVLMVLGFILVLILVREMF